MKSCTRVYQIVDGHEVTIRLVKDFIYHFPIGENITIFNFKSKELMHVEVLSIEDTYSDSIFWRNMLVQERVH